MKKILLLLLLIAGGLSIVEAKTISLKPNDWIGGGWCALWVWEEGQSGSFVNLAGITPSDGVYEVTVGNNITNWKLVRGHDGVTWDNKWNESGNITATDDFIYNFDKIKDNITVGDGISTTVIFHSCSIIGDFMGSFDIGDEEEMSQDPENENIYTLVSEVDVTAKTYYYKLIANHKYGVYELPGSGNNSFTFNEAGTFQLTFTANVSSHTLSLTAKKVVNVGSSGKATFSSVDAHNFSGIDNLKSYVVSALTASYATLTEVSDVPASTGVILIGSTGKYYVPFGGATGLPGGVTNMLQASTGATDVSEGQAYVLSNGEFHPAEAGTIPAGKAYLLAENIPAGARSLSLVFEEETTGIENLKVKDETFKFFNLAGQHVKALSKGLYIVNGKKVIIK